MAILKLVVTGFVRAFVRSDGVRVSLKASWFSSSVNLVRAEHKSAGSSVGGR